MVRRLRWEDLENIAVRQSKRWLHLDTGMRWLNRGIRAISFRTHQIQYNLDWKADNPEYFDHYLGQNYMWRKTRESFPVERGVWSSFAIRPSAEVLDLCCGDGFNAYHFYSRRSKSVTAVDFDPHAIRWARRNFRARNLTFHCLDIRASIPAGPFDNIIWDAAIEHFTEDEIATLMPSIKTALTPSGILSGYTIVERHDGEKSLHQHEYEFHGKEDLARFLTPYFVNVRVFETVFPSRTNLYFYATDGLPPFESETSLSVTDTRAFTRHPTSAS